MMATLGCIFRNTSEKSSTIGVIARMFHDNLDSKRFRFGQRGLFGIFKGEAVCAYCEVLKMNERVLMA